MKHKTLRQLLAIVLVVMMLVPNFALPTLAEDTVTVTIGDVQNVTPGDTIQVPISISGNFSTAQVLLDYDKDLLTLTKVAKGTDWASKINTSGECTFSNSILEGATYNVAIEVLDEDQNTAMLNVSNAEFAVATFTVSTSANKDIKIGATIDIGDDYADTLASTLKTGTIKIAVADAVAEVTDVTGATTSYSSIGAAFNAANNSNTVKLLKDVALSYTTGDDTYPREYLVVTKNITLDLNGHSFTGGSYEGVGLVRVEGSSGILTVIDFSEAQNGSITAVNSYTGGTGKTYSPAISVQNGGSLTLKSGTVDIITAYTGSTVKIEGGTVSENLEVLKKTCYGDSGEITWLENGAATAAGNDARATTKTTITGGTIEKLDVKVGDFTMTNGTVNSKVDIGACAREVKISGGTFNLGTSSISFSPTYPAVYPVTATISGGRFINNGFYMMNISSGDITITGGYFESNTYTNRGNAADNNIFRCDTSSTDYKLTITGGEFVKNDQGAMFLLQHSSSATSNESHSILDIGGTAKFSSAKGTIFSVANGYSNTNYVITGGSYKPASGYPVVSYNSATTESADNYIKAGYKLSAADSQGWYTLEKTYDAYTLTVKTDKATCNVGDIVTATIYVNGLKDHTLGNATITLASTAGLEYVADSFTTTFALQEESNNGTSYAYVISGDGAAITSDEFAVATAQFKVAATSCGTGTISFDDKNFVGEVNGVQEKAPGSTGTADVAYHAAHAVTIKGNTHTNQTADTTLYAKVGDSVNLYSDAACKTASSFSFTANAGYEGSGYIAGGTTYANLAALAAAAQGSCSGLTVEQNVTAKQFTFTATDTDDYAFTDITGVTEGKFTVETDTITFKVEGKNGQIVDEVSYSVDGKTIQNSKLTPNDTGVYTINLDPNNLGNITVKATVKTSVKVTFAVYGGNATVNGADSVVLYAKRGGGTGTFYTDEACSETATATLTLAASDGYRNLSIAQDGYEWYTSDDGGASLTSSISDWSGYTFSGDVTFYTKAIQTFTVTYAVNPADAATLTDNVVPYDAGTPKTRIEAAANDYFNNLTVADKYQLADTKWTQGDVDVTDSFANLNANTTITRNYTVKTFALTGMTSTEDYTVSVTVNGAAWDGTSEVAYGSEVVITVKPTDNKYLTDATVKHGTTDITADPNTDSEKVFTINGVKDAITLTADSENYITVTVKATQNAGGSVTTTDSFTVKKGTEASAFAFDETNGTVTYGGKTVTAVPAAGYKFGGWSDLTGTLNESTEITATFDHQTYKVILQQGFSSERIDYVTHGTDYTLDKVDGNTVRFLVGVYVGQTAVAHDGYTVAGSLITGDLTYVVTEKTFTLTFISREQFPAAPEGTKVAVLQVNGENTAAGKYTYGEKTFYWSDLYKAYVAFVDADVTASTLLNGLVYDNKDGATPVVVSANGDVTNNGSVTSVDAGVVNDVLFNHLSASLSDLQRFAMDVTNNGTHEDDWVSITVNGETVYPTVTTLDIKWILDEAVGLH